MLRAGHCSLLTRTTQDGQSLPVDSWEYHPSTCPHPKLSPWILETSPGNRTEPVPRGPGRQLAVALTSPDETSAPCSARGHVGGKKLKTYPLLLLQPQRPSGAEPAPAGRLGQGGEGASCPVLVAQSWVCVFQGLIPGSYCPVQRAPYASPAHLVSPVVLLHGLSLSLLPLPSHPLI